MKHFNNALIICAYLGFFLTACEKEPLKISKENGFDIPFKSTVNEQVLLTNQSSRVVLEIKSISDKRCQENHDACPNPGNATVRFILSNLDNSKAESMLHLGMFNEQEKDIDSVMLQLDGRSYLVSLHSINQDSSTETKIQAAEFCVKSR